MNYEAARTERGNVRSNSVFLLAIVCVYLYCFLADHLPPTFSLSVCTFFIGFVIGREAHAIYSYIGAATINEQGALHLHFCFLFLLTSTHTRGRSANE